MTCGISEEENGFAHVAHAPIAHNKFFKHILVVGVQLSGKLWFLPVLFFVLVIASVYFFGFSRPSGYTSAGIALISASLFPVIYFFLVYFADIPEEWFLLHNPWVKDVEEMDDWFNRMFSTWLYFHDKKRWKRGVIKTSLPIAIFIGAFIVWFITRRWVTLGELLTGVLIGSTYTTLLTIALHQRYV